MASLAVSHNLHPIPELNLTLAWAFACRGDVEGTKKWLQGLNDNGIEMTNDRNGNRIHAAAAILTAHSIAREHGRNNTKSSGNGGSTSFQRSEYSLQIYEMRALFGREMDVVIYTPEWQQRVFTLCLENCAAARAFAAAEQWYVTDVMILWWCCGPP